MIAIQRTACVIPGRMPSAIGFAQEISAYIKSAHGVELEVLLPIGGNPTRVAWVSRFKDLAAYDAYAQKLLADKEFSTRVSKASDNFVPGSFDDALWRTV
jgi:hypothetical protein